MYITRNYAVLPKTFGGLMDEIFQNGFNRINADANFQSVPVNVIENENDFLLQIVAPGIKKDDFKISVDRNILSIAYEHKEEATEKEAGKRLKTEYKIKSFKRSFTINEHINTGEITAKYNDGILHVSLPKKEKAESATKEIQVN